MKAIRIVCTGRGSHTESWFGSVEVSHVGEGRLADMLNVLSGWLRDSALVLQGYTGLPPNVKAEILSTLLAAPQRVVIDGWVVTDLRDIVRTWPHLELGESPTAGERRVTLQPFTCRRCEPKRNVPLRLETLERLCAEAAAAGESQLDISRIG